MLGTLLEEQSIVAMLEVPQRVELTLQSGKGQSFIFVLNHNESPVERVLPQPMFDLLPGQTSTGSIVLGAYEVAILKK